MNLFNKKDSKKTEQEKVEERREEVLATGRKFKYPLQWTKHRIVINTILIGAIVLAVLIVGGWLALYRFNMTDDLLFRLTKILPVPVAYVDSNEVSLESTLKEWDEVEKAIGSIIGKAENADFTVSRSLGTITVTASPSVLARVSEYIDRQNKRLSQLVTIDVKVLQVTISNNSAFGLNLAAAINSTSGLNIVANPKNNLASTEASSMNIAVLSNTVSALTGATHMENGSVVEGAYTNDQIMNGSLSGAAGSNALIEALAKQGKVSLVTNVGVTTRSNRVAPVSNTRTTGYIKRFESRNFTTVESSTVDQDDLETGFTMQLLPNVLENGRILLLFRMSVRELLRMSTQTIGEVTLQLPEVEERSFMQEVIMESGQMLVVSGFEKQTNQDTRYGLGDPDFMALSGSRETKSAREVLVVILTPQVLVSPMDVERGIQQHWGAPLN